MLLADVFPPPSLPSSSATALKMNVNLRELYLADNKLNSLQDSAQLGNLLKFNCSIQILDLRNNHILDSGERVSVFLLGGILLLSPPGLWGTPCTVQDGRADRRASVLPVKTTLRALEFS